MERNKKENIRLEFDYHGTHYEGLAIPVETSCNEDGCFELNVTLNGNPLGTIYRTNNIQWKLRGSADQNWQIK